jgi:beta-glucanase (GH16 family)
MDSQRKLRFLVPMFALFFWCVRAVLAASPANYYLEWSDEFNGSSLDTNKWAHRALGPRNDAVNTASAISLTNGSLIITSYTEGGTNFTGLIGSQNLYMPLFGYLEARIRFNGTQGEWSAFWLQSPTIDGVGDPHAYGTEVDIVEHRAVNASNKNIADTAVSNVHWDGYGTEHKTVGTPRVGSGLSTGWHVYAIDWRTNLQHFYYDEVLVWSVTNSPAQDPVPPEAPVSQRSQYLILSSEVRDNGWAGTIPVGGYGNRVVSTTRMEVDYVRSYAPSPAIGLTNLGDGHVIIACYGSVGRSYIIEQSTNISGWTPLVTNMAAADGLSMITNAATRVCAFYRARAN